MGPGDGPFFPEGPKEKRDHPLAPPRALSQATGTIAARSTKTDPMTSLRIAILDDDEDVREVAADVLRDARARLK